MAVRKQPLIYVYPAANKQLPEFKQAISAFKAISPKFSEEAAPARGGFDFTPSLHVSLKFAGELALIWILSGVGTDAYKALKAGIRKLLKIKPPRPSDWPDSLPDPKYVGLILQIETESHSFIIDFSFDDEASLMRAMDSLPSFITSLSINSNPTHHLLLWDKNHWTVSYSQSSVR